MMKYNGLIGGGGGLMIKLLMYLLHTVPSSRGFNWYVKSNM